MKSLTRVIKTIRQYRLMTNVCMDAVKPTGCVLDREAAKLLQLNFCEAMADLSTDEAAHVLRYIEADPKERDRLWTEMCDASAGNKIIVESNPTRSGSWVERVFGVASDPWRGT